MENYLNLLSRVLNTGIIKSDRTNTGIISVFGDQLRFDLSKGFPLITTKKCHLKSIIYELLWFLSGSTNIHDLQQHGVTIWNEWADSNGNLGPVYGKQWRCWEGANGVVIDQISNVIKEIQTNPNSRRLIVNAWNVAELSHMAIPPCHTMFQFYIVENKLSCQLYQRSADIFLGVPFNIASYALLLMMVAQVTNLIPGEFVHTFGDLHLYINHIEQAKLQLTRTPYSLPRMLLNDNVKSIFEFKYEDFTLIDYKYHPAIKAPIAV